MQRFQWCVLPQGMMNRPTICQMYVHKPLEQLHIKFPTALVIHYIDILLAHASQTTLDQVFKELLVLLSQYGLKIAPEKIQTQYHFLYLGMKIEEKLSLRKYKYEKTACTH